MNAQIFQDIVAIGGMFFLRIGLPLLIVMGVGYLVRRGLEPTAVKEQFEGMVGKAQEPASQPVVKTAARHEK